MKLKSCKLKKFMKKVKNGCFVCECGNKIYMLGFDDELQKGKEIICSNCKTEYILFGKGENK